MSTAVKKTYNLDAEMIEEVRRVFHAKTDTEAIRRALQKTLDDDEVERTLDQILRSGRFRTVYR
jgi:hypothetical protein